MVTIRSATDGAGLDPGPDGGPGAGLRAEVPAPRRRVERLRGLPSSRAVVGGLLVALAGVGTLVTWQRASGSPDHAYAVADRPILPGETITAADVRLVPIDLPGGVAVAAFTDGRDVEGRVALGPLGEGELVQLGQLSEAGAAAPAAEVSLALGRDRAVDGRLRSGDLVDVFVTYDDRTEAVVERVRLVSLSDAGAASFSTGTEVTVTLALTDPSRRTPLIHAARAGDVTLVRSTHLPAATPPAPDAATTPAAPGDGMGDGAGDTDAPPDDGMEGDGGAEGPPGDGTEGDAGSGGGGGG